MGPISTILSDESKWVQGMFAADSTNLGCDVQAPMACKFCLVGAALKAVTIGEGKYDAVEHAGNILKLMDAVHKYTGKDTPVLYFNDSPKTTFKDIQNVLEIAGL